MVDRRPKVVRYVLDDGTGLTFIAFAPASDAAGEQHSAFISFATVMDAAGEQHPAFSQGILICWLYQAPC